MRESGEETAALRTTKCTVLFPCLPPFPVFIDNIQNLALGERDLVGVIYRRGICGASSVLAKKSDCKTELARTCIQRFCLVRVLRI